MKMNDPERSQFLISRPRVPTDEAARFVETRVIMPGQNDAVYSERRGNFVTLQEGKREEQIRSAYTSLRKVTWQALILSLTR